MVIVKFVTIWNDQIYELSRIVKYYIEHIFNCAVAARSENLTWLTQILRSNRGTKLYGTNANPCIITGNVGQFRKPFSIQEPATTLFSRGHFVLYQHGPGMMMTKTTSHTHRASSAEMNDWVTGDRRPNIIQSVIAMLAKSFQQLQITKIIHVMLVCLCLLVAN